MIKAGDLNHNNSFDIASLKSGDFGLIIHKCTQGRTFADPKCPGRKAIVLADGSIVWSAYHWLSPDNQGAAQAAWFIKNAGELKSMPWIDFEEDDPSLTMAQHFANLKACYDVLVAHYFACGVYTGKWFIDQLVARAEKNGEPVVIPDWFKGLKIWLSDYDHDTPVEKFDWMNVVIHQRDDKLSTHGTATGGDYDMVLVDLSTLAIGANAPISSAPPAPTSPIGTSRQHNFTQVAAELGYEDRAKTLLSFWLAKYPNANPRYWALVDFSLPKSKRRLFVIDSDNSGCVSHCVSNGSGSDDGTFGTTDGSHESEVGIFRVAETYEGVHGYSCRIDGLESSNFNVRDRDIVIHPATYVSDEGQAGDSWGCFALDPSISESVIDELKDGSPLYAFV